MIIKIRFFGYFEEYLGTGINELEVPFGCTLGNLFYLLADIWSDKFVKIWDYDKNIFITPFIVMVDGHDIHDLDYLLTEGSLVTLIPPIVGG